MKPIKQFLTAMMTTALVATGATVAMAEGAKIFVIGGKADDPFWSKVKKGADDAGKVAEVDGRLGDLARSAELRQPGPGRSQAHPHGAEPESQCHRRPRLGARGRWTMPSRKSWPPASRSSSTIPAAWKQPSSSAP